MKSLWIRLGIVVGVLAVMAFGASTLAARNPEKKDVYSCGSLRQQDACATTCDGSVYTQGDCHDKRNKVVEFRTLECCCCTEGWQGRAYHF